MKTPLPLARACAWADAFSARIESACTQVLVCGSIRRQKPTVGDIEVVCAPIIEDRCAARDLFGGDIYRPHDLLLERLEQAVSAGAIVPGVRLGPRFRQYGIPKLDAQLDIFIVRPPAEWGAIVAIRTGPAEYSAYLMRRAVEVGLEQAHGHIKDAWGRAVPTPTEESYFAALKLPWIEPCRRMAPR